MKEKISLIVAMAQNYVIGSENAMPWHIPGELPRFRRITTGGPIVMGRKTHESMGRVLPDRLNIIITRDEKYQVEGAVVVHSLEEALEEGKKYYESPHLFESKPQSRRPDPLPQGAREEEEEIFIIGGGQIFKEALPLADRLYLTLIHQDIPGDTYFPRYETIFTSPPVSREDHHTEGYDFSYLIFEKGKV